MLDEAAEGVLSTNDDPQLYWTVQSSLEVQQMHL